MRWNLLLFSCMVLCIPVSLFAQKLPQSQTMRGGSGPGVMPPPLGGAPLEQKPLRPPPSQVVPKPPPIVKVVSQYFHPGALIFSEGKWQGGDYLYGLSNQMGVYLDIIIPEDITTDLRANVLQKRVEELFKQEGIVPNTIVMEGRPPLPFFQIQILAYPLGTGFAACCKGSLFESVFLKRVNFENNPVIFQAITWERESLIVAPGDTFTTQVESSVMETAKAFLERYQFFRRSRAVEFSE